MGNLNSITFGNINSADFGIFISGEGVYDAPVRRVEAITIPGRSGDLLLDDGSYSNIEITYPAFLYVDTYEGFTDRIDEFRNAILSQVGYQRLTDSFHPNEYRMAILGDAFEVEVVKHNSAAYFDIVFNCKPQRYLKSGEVAQDLTEGGSIFNPTYFESTPLLKVEGYGDINLNGYDIAVSIAPVGKTLLFNGKTGGASVSMAFGNVPYNQGDQITVEDSIFTGLLRPKNSAILGVQIASTTGDAVALDPAIQPNGDLAIGLKMNEQTFTQGTAQTMTATITVNIQVKVSSSTDLLSEQVTLTASLGYVNTERVRAYSNITASQHTEIEAQNVTVGDGFIDSTASSLGKTLYIDCELGEAYVGDQSFNSSVSFPDNLPVLAPGDNEVTVSSHITKLEIIPRWWKI